MPCFVLLCTFTFVGVPCVWVGVGGREGGRGKILSIFYTDMDYLYCMPKWSHSRFYEIKLLRNISIYWYIKFIKSVPRYILTLSGFYEFSTRTHLLHPKDTASGAAAAADQLFGDFSLLDASDWAAAEFSACWIIWCSRWCWHCLSKVHRRALRMRGSLSLN